MALTALLSRVWQKGSKHTTADPTGLYCSLCIIDRTTVLKGFVIRGYSLSELNRLLEKKGSKRNSVEILRLFSVFLVKAEGLEIPGADIELEGEGG